MSEPLLNALRGLRLADPDLGLKPLLAKLREQQPDLGAATREVREALTALKAEESEAAKATPAQPAADEGVLPAADKGDAPSPVAVSLACVGCGRLPSDMDDAREKHPVCRKCVKDKLLTTYWCGLKCPANPRAWELHAVYHKEVKVHRKETEDGGFGLWRLRAVAEEAGRQAAQTGSAYAELVADGLRYETKEDWRRAARVYREAIALRPDEPCAFSNLGAVLCNSGHHVEAAQRFLEASKLYQEGSEQWAQATADSFDMLRQEACAEVAKPEWWDDEGLKALSARVVKLAPNHVPATQMRAIVLSGMFGAWEEGPRSAAELKKAAMHFERAAAMSPAPAMKAAYAGNADQCRSQAMYR